jgi:hypothetical protein
MNRNQWVECLGEISKNQEWTMINNRILVDYLYSECTVTGREWFGIGNMSGYVKLTVNYCGDIHPYDGPKFPDVEILVMNGCDKNFVYYWLNKRIFPNVKEIWLNSHPCDSSVLGRFKNAIIYLSDRFERFKMTYHNNVTLYKF